MPQLVTRLVTRLVFVARSLPSENIPPFTLQQDIYGPLHVRVDQRHVIVHTSKLIQTEDDADLVKRFVCNATGIRGKSGLFTTRVSA